MTTLPTVTVALATFRRPGPLAAALAAIRIQVDAENAAGAQEFDILVVDNDPAATGREVAESFGARYVVEQRPGIAAARNRALDETVYSRAIVFLDDDEIPQADWLRHLIARYDETGATAVAGRVITVFPPDAEQWVLDSGAFRRPERVDGARMREAATNNLLLDVAGIRALDLRFDERFGLTGGSDSMFTRALTARGGQIRWAQHAVVVEQEEAARFRRSWVLMRTFRFGNTAARVDLALAAGVRGRTAARLRVAARGSARVVGGGVRWIGGAVLRRSARRARAERTIARGVGMLAGITGYAHDEYGRRRRSGS